MVANTIQELIPVTPNAETCNSDTTEPIHVFNPDSLSNDPIALFLSRNRDAPIVVDFLNVMIAGTYFARSFVDLYKTLRQVYKNSPIIIVTKKVESWPNINASNAEEVTLVDPAILVVVCDTQGAKKRRCENKSDSTSVLAEADDYMIALIDYITSASGCRAKVLSDDKYRNRLNVVETMLPYDYYVHSSGQTSQHHMSTEFAVPWIQSVVSYARPFRKECKIAVTRKCKSCRASRPVCIKCITCASCIAAARIDFGE